ncbi:hypothetical protein E2562_005793 [Oryza meyeriana var. granulata]|uniref:Uncharacterized protein n=1 Tax=Oryza meyeriana var. granulata TaxID=110450 RepID=A0A6G1F4K6_9ORYZ|nr:hypothetical protein E2562_005793 [Oryza meyeriana var. granulata]
MHRSKEAISFSFCLDPNLFQPKSPNPPLDGVHLPRWRLVALVSRRTAAEGAVYVVVLRQAALVEEATTRGEAPGASRLLAAEDACGGIGSCGLLGDAYDRCGEVCAEYAKTFYLATSPYKFGVLVGLQD